MGNMTVRELKAFEELNIKYQSLGIFPLRYRPNSSLKWWRRRNRALFKYLSDGHSLDMGSNGGVVQF